MEKQFRFEGAVLLTLSLLLVTVFMLSVSMYDDLEGATGEGTIAVFAGEVREFLNSNAAVSVFLGLHAEGEEVSAEPSDPERTKAEAAAYIARYNRLYTDLQ